jgi:hypothetical protein
VSGCESAAGAPARSGGSYDLAGVLCSPAMDRRKQLIKAIEEAEQEFDAAKRLSDSTAPLKSCNAHRPSWAGSRTSGNPSQLHRQCEADYTGPKHK